MSADQEPGSGVAQRDPVRLGGWTWVGVVGVATCAYALCIVWPQAKRTETLHLRVAALKADVAEARLARNLLDAEAKALEDDPYAVERALRSRVRYLRPGEQVLAQHTAEPTAR